MGSFTFSPHFPLSLSCAGQQVVSRQRNRLNTLQETYIVLYKLFPPNNKRKVWTNLEEEKEEEEEGSHLLKDKWLQTVRKCFGKKQTNKLCGRNTGLSIILQH